MTRHAAARAIAKTPLGLAPGTDGAVLRETVLAALEGVAILPETERRFEGTVCLADLRVAGGLYEDQDRPMRFEVDIENATAPRAGCLVLGAYWDGHAYRVGLALAHGRGGSLAYYEPLPGGGDEAVVFPRQFRPLGCVVRWWGTNGHEEAFGVECPQGAPWSREWRIGSVQDPNPSAERLKPTSQVWGPGSLHDARGIPF